MPGSSLVYIDDHPSPALRAAARAAGMDSAYLLEIARQRRAEGFAAWIASLFTTHRKGDDNGYSQATAPLGRRDPDYAGGGRR
jgi:hypothetical protein